MSLKNILIYKIKNEGPITIDEYIRLCLSHPEYGYYIKKDPLGAKGDFITSPEISQLFGEMVGVWVATNWLNMGAPKIKIIELGPGRGTLMADLLRATKNVKNFHESIEIKLVESSPVLRKKQEESLSKFGIKTEWLDETKFSGEPFILIANEFFDALPTKQFIKEKSGWKERTVTEKNSELHFTNLEKDVSSFIPKKFLESAMGTIFEKSLATEEIFNSVCKELKKVKGLALIIDYGHYGDLPGDTLQALKDNKFHDVLKDPGDADITTHVNFGVLKEIAERNSIKANLKEQGEFLKELGIEMRAEILSKNKPEEQKKEIYFGLNRLIKDEEMGRLFKVLTLAS